MNVRRVAVLTVLIFATASALFPCGGVLNYPIDAPFVDDGQMLDRVLGMDPYWGPASPDELTFVHPLAAARPAATAPVATLLDARADRWLVEGSGRLHDSLLGVLPSVSLGPFRAALAADDLAGARREALAIVSTVLDMPSLLADVYAEPFRRAVEFLELGDVLAGLPLPAVRAFYADSASADPGHYPAPLREAVRIRGMSRTELAAYADSATSSPRAPSLRFVALQRRMQVEIPDGWTEDIRRAMTPERWQALHEAHARWLAAYANSPLADLVRFSELRLYYLAGDTTGAWRLLLDRYPDHHYARVVWEMRFLMRQEMRPDSAARAHPHFDGPLRAATTSGRVAGDWCASWREAEAHRPEPWALNIEERLLYALAPEPSYLRERGIEIPSCFPDQPAAPSPFWGRMRLMDLVMAHRERDARAQLALLDSTEDLSALRARFAVEDGRWTEAALTPALDSAAVLYLVRVLAPDSVLRTLSGRGPGWIRREAVLTRAIALSAEGDWTAGAQLLDGVDDARAARWRAAAALAGDTTFAGRVAFARYLQGQRGRLMYERDGMWYRSVGARLPPEDSSSMMPVYRLRSIVPDEAQRIVRHLERSTESYLALKAYAAALDAPDADRVQLAGLVREADGVYRSLVDWYHASTTFWYVHLRSSPEAAAIRRAGRRVRSSP